YDTASSVSVFSSPMPNIGGLFVGATTLYFAAPNRVTKFSTSTGASTDIAISGQALAADVRFIYFVDGTNLKYMSVAGGNSGVLATVPSNGVTAMFVADHFDNPVLYWSQSDGKILKLTAPKTAPTATPSGPTSRLVNLSVRSSAGTGDQT